MRRSTTAEVRPDQGNAASSDAERPSVSPFSLPTGRPRSNFVATRLGQTEDRAQQPGYPGDVSQDRCQGRQPRPLRDVSVGRGRGFAADVRGNPVADRPATSAACASMSGAGSDDAPATTAEVRPGAGKAAFQCASVESTSWFARLLRMRSAIYCCPKRPNGRSWPRTARKPGNVGLT
jgi:hypothetical protein